MATWLLALLLAFAFVGFMSTALLFLAILASLRHEARDEDQELAEWRAELEREGERVIDVCLARLDPADVAKWEAFVRERALRQ